MKYPNKSCAAAFLVAGPAFAGCLVLGLPHAASAAERSRETSPFKTTTTPATATSGPIVNVETDGPVSNRYQAYGVAKNTTFDLTGAHLAGSPQHPMRTAITIGEQDTPPENLRIVGGVVDGGIPREWNWYLTHGFGGSGIYSVATGLQVLEGARIHNVEDGWDPRETPSFKLRAYPNTGRLLMRGCYMTAIRDDSIENDEFIPGDIEDCLFDGVWTFYSEQNERQSGLRRPRVETIGPNEDPTIRITRVLARVTVTNGKEDRAGRWFKLSGGESPLHRLILTDCVFAIDVEPRSGWRVCNFPKDAIFRGTNYVLWLGKPGAYGAGIPAEVEFLEGDAAREKWHTVRNEWLVAHGYEPRLPSDWNPMEAPVEAPRRPRS